MLPFVIILLPSETAVIKIEAHPKKLNLSIREMPYLIFM